MTLLLVLLVLLVPAAEPDRMTLAELEATFGPNVLEPDPAGLGPPPGVPDDTDLHRWYGENPRSLNALAVNDGNLIDSLLIYTMLDPGLRHRDDPERWAPGIADYASISEDRRTATIRIRPGITWQFPAVDRAAPQYAWLVDLFARGAPELTAEDFRFTLETMQNPATPCHHLRPYYEGVSLIALDRYTFQMRWDTFFVHALELALSWQQVLPRFLYERDEAGRRIPAAEFGSAFAGHWHLNKICGYGPYRFAGMSPGVEIVLERKDDFPVFRPAIRTMHWQIIPDGEQCVLRMLDGQLDYITLMPEQLRRYWLTAPEGSGLKDGRFVFQPYEKSEYSYFGWNCRRPPFGDVRVRRAMAHSFNREAIFEKVFQGFGALVNGPVFDKHPHHAHDVHAPAFDLEQASRLLDQAGWGDANGDGVRDKRIDGAAVDFRFTMVSYAGSPEYDTLMAIWGDDLARIGVDMEVDALPWPQFLQRVYRDRDFDAYAGTLATSWSLDFFHKFHGDSIQEGSNHVGFRHPEVDVLAARYRAIADPAERQEIALRIQELLQQEQPLTYFMRRNRMTVYPRWLKNVHYAVARPQLASYAWYAAAE